MVPPRGFEPLISALKGRRPRPLDDEGEHKNYQKEGTMRAPPAAHQLEPEPPGLANKKAEVMIPRPDLVAGVGLEPTAFGL